ncbi:MAG: YciI family protein [Gemmatimonadaceae bacterium]
MKYLLIMCGDETAEVATPMTTAAADVAAMPACASWIAEMERRGVLRNLVGLQPSSDATVVRVRGDEVLLSDGPFTETKDQIGGFGLIECTDRDEAIEVASKHPAAKLGLIEVRPIR